MSISSPRGRPSNRSAWATGWTGTALTRTGPEAAGRAPKSTSRWRSENNYTIWGFLKKCHDRKLIYTATTRCRGARAAASASARWKWNEGYKIVAHDAVFVKFPAARAGPGENLLVWTTTPWTLSCNVGAAVNPKLTYLKVKHKDEIYYVAKGAFTAHAVEEAIQAQGMGRRRPQAQDARAIFKEKGGYEIVGEVLGEDMVGWQYDGPFDELPAQDHPPAIPTKSRRVREKLKWCPEGCQQVSPSRHRLGSRRRNRRHRHRSHRPRLRQGRLRTSARSRACPPSPRSMNPASSSKASAN